MEKHRLWQFTWLLISPTAFLSLASFLIYFARRLKSLVKVQQATDEYLGGAWFYLTIECLTLVPNALPYVLRILAHRPDRTKETLEGNDVPTVDILITCCNEDIDLILNTVRAACVLDYPKDRYRVFVCDDGASGELKLAVEKLPYSNVFYNARKKGPVKDYKAGNLNANLIYSGSLPLRMAGNDPSGTWKNLRLRPHFIMESSSMDPPALVSTDLGSSEYVAGLDADMIPEPHWLRVMLPHFIEDRNMGLACPPQTFYDIPENDPLTQTMDHFGGIQELFNDALNHADCLGSGYVMRRSAIESVGGIPTESLSEDVCSSAALLGAGWNTAFVHEPVQYGSVPESLFAHVKQRTRWFVGNIQIAMLFKFHFCSTRGKYFTWRQRIAGLAFDLGQIVQIPNILAWFSIPYCLLRGYPVVVYTDKDDLKGLIRCATTWMICHWTHQSLVGCVAGLVNRSYDIRLPSLRAELDHWIAPYIALSFFRSFVLPERFGGKKAGFTATGSLQDNLQERDAQHRAPIHRRLYVTMIDQHLVIHMVFLLACAAGVGLTFARAIPGTIATFSFSQLRRDLDLDRLIYLIVRIGWPPLVWLQYFTSVMCPVLYVFFPPSIPDRASMLVIDEKTGAAYPKQEARKTKRTVGIAWRYFRPAFSMVYTVVLIYICAWM